MRKTLTVVAFASSVIVLSSSSLAQSADAQPTEEIAEPNPFRMDAESIEDLIKAVYAYDQNYFDGGYVFSDGLRAEAAAVTDQSSLLAFAERAVASLADHHAITGPSFSNSYAVVPAYSDLWIEKSENQFLVTSVRAGSPAEQAGVRVGDRLTMLDDQDVTAAASAYFEDLGYQGSAKKFAYAARVLAAGRRDTSRKLTLTRMSGEPYSVDLPSLYTVAQSGKLVASQIEGDALVITANDSLGNSDTIAAFDKAMEGAQPGQKIIIDLTNTASGGNTVIARAILGWFVTEPRFYQVHALPGEQRATGIARRWVEQVLPREGKFHDGPVEVRVGRWTGSMGEGLAVGFDAIGACVYGTPMAGLLGAIYDHRLRHSGMVIKLPTERLFHINGTPREDFMPHINAASCPK